MAQMKVEDVRPRRVAVIRRTVATDALGPFFTDVFALVPDAVGRVGGVVSGEPFAWYHGAPTHEVDVAAGFPVDGLEPGEVPPDVVVLDRPGGMAAVALHVGPYDDLPRAYRELEVWLRDRAFDVGDDSWEEYLADDEEAGEPRTRIIWPLI